MNMTFPNEHCLAQVLKVSYVDKNLRPASILFCASVNSKLAK